MNEIYSILQSLHLPGPGSLLIIFCLLTLPYLKDLFVFRKKYQHTKLKLYNELQLMNKEFDEEAMQRMPFTKEALAKLLFEKDTGLKDVGQSLRQAIYSVQPYLGINDSLRLRYYYSYDNGKFKVKFRSIMATIFYFLFLFLYIGAYCIVVFNAARHTVKHIAFADISAGIFIGVTFILFLLLTDSIYSCYKLIRLHSKLKKSY
ncbi:MAG: hypothetical protein K0S08_1388 [Gammaproteobacteria bacterium]|jgi:hypothetical protein|nr:hypothetical protein [Gammaproteobacteria bacterium]